MRAKDCANCGSFDTERVHVEWHSDMIEEVRICNECPAQFTVKYNLFAKDVDEGVEVA